MHVQLQNCIAPILLAGGVVASSVQAATVAHWRFEGDGSTYLTDSSGNGRTLSEGGTGITVEPAARAATGPTSDFFDPIPRTGAQNDGVAWRGGGGSSPFSDNAYVYVGDDAAFTSNTFTLEAMFNMTARNTSSGNSGNGFLAGQWGGNSQSSYALFLGANGALQLVLRQQSVGSSNPATEFVNPQLTYSVGNDYYIGVSVDLTGATAGDRSATFYFQDLTAGTAMQVVTRNNIAVSDLHDSTNQFTIGSGHDGSNARMWNGYVDEVRLSNVALSQDQLLATVPEPTSLLASGGLAAMLLARRRRCS